ncbi:sensor histidine kinase [Actinomadura flavalba]|uniref:sensor histidine kinase n=1 Tax=Actinomadura flavalba TaxID=1120938 RepID=UPI00037C5AD1|nr:histidine kinase [Actinomadura flavalba]
MTLASAWWRRPGVADTALGVLLTVPVLLGLPRHGTAWAAPLAGAVLLGASMTVARRAPAVPLGVAVASTAVSGNFVFAVPVLALLAGRRDAGPRPVAAVFAVLLAGGAAWHLLAGTGVTVWFPLTFHLVLWGVAPWLAGRYWRQRRQLLHAGWERAEHLERHQRTAADRERLRERARIARELHDSLGHDLALLALRAGALQLAPDLPARHRAAAADLRAGAALATDRLAEILGVLHDDTPDTPDAASVTAASGAGVRRAGRGGLRAGVAELVARAAASGLRVRLDDALDPVDDPVPRDGDAPPRVSPMVELAVCRVVREALTNAAKHAPGAAVTVRLAAPRPGRLTVTVANTRPPGGAPVAAGTGLGLTGLTERVRVAGGTLRAASTADGGFTVHAALPAGDRPAPVPPPLAAGSESARRLAAERDRVRRRLRTAVAVPALLLAGLGAITGGYYVVVSVNSVLPSAAFAALPLGATRAELASVLPPLQLPASDVGRRPAPRPPGTRCAHYRSDANPFGLGDVHRLCFTGDRLTAKHALPPHGPPRAVPSGKDTP